MSEISGISGITKIFLLLISCIISVTRSQLTGAEIFYSNGPEKMRLINELKENCGRATNPVIALGSQAGDHEFPWMVALVYENHRNESKIMCGGSLISPNVVMTAAHCLNAGGDICGTTESDYMLKKIKFGHAKLSSKISKQVDIDIGSIQHHPNYQPCFRGHVKDTVKMTNDIALFKLSTKLLLSRDVQTICLPEDYSENETFLNLEVAGWGKTSASETTMNDQLQKLDMEYVNKATCENIYGRRMLNLGENRLCAQDEKESFVRRGRRGLFGDHCKGDSGGPLMGENLQTGQTEVIGIVSAGLRCNSYLPSIYPRVSKYLPWIKDFIYNASLPGAM